MVFQKANFYSVIEENAANALRICDLQQLMGEFGLLESSAYKALRLTSWDLKKALKLISIDADADFFQ